MTPWNLTGTPGYAAGAAPSATATVTVPPDATILQIIAHSSNAANGSFAIFGGAATPIINGAAPTVISFNHRLYASQGTGASAQVVFTNCDSYAVFYVRSGNI